MAVRIMMHLKGQTDLLQVVCALDPAGRLSSRLHGRQQQGDQDADDRDHDQQLDQGEPTRLITVVAGVRAAIAAPEIIASVITAPGIQGVSLLHARGLPLVG